MKPWIDQVFPSTTRQAFVAASIMCMVGSALFVVVFDVSGASREFSLFGQDGYFELATSLVRGDGFVFEPGGEPVHHRPPLYPLVLIPLVVLPAAFQFSALVLLHSAMIGCAGALVFGIAHKAFSLQTARLALGVFFVNPWLYSNVTNPLTPVLQCGLFTAFVYLIGQEVGILPANTTSRGKRLPRWLSIGAVGGFLSLTHGTLIAVNGAVVLCLILLAITRRSWSQLRTAGLALLVSVMLIAPWTYRNWVSFDRLIPVVAGAGLMYTYQERHLNVSPRVDVETKRRPAEANRAGPLRFHGTTSEEIERELEQRMLDAIRSSPGGFGRALAFNATAYYFPSLAELYRPEGVRRWPKEKVALTTFHAVLWTLAGLGLWSVRSSRERFALCLFLLAGVFLYAVWYFPFFTSVTHTMYTFATTPTLAILAALGVSALLSATELAEKRTAEG